MLSKEPPTYGPSHFMLYDQKYYQRNSNCHLSNAFLYRTSVEYEKVLSYGNIFSFSEGSKFAWLIRKIFNEKVEAESHREAEYSLMCIYLFSMKLMMNIRGS